MPISASEQTRINDAQKSRTEAQKRMAAAFNLAVTKAGYGAQARVIRAVGVSKALVQRWRDDDDLATPSMADVVCMPPDIRDEMLRVMAAEAGRVVVERPDVPNGKAVIDPATTAMRESGEAFSAYARFVAHPCTQTALAALRETQEGAESQHGMNAAVQEWLDEQRGLKAVG